MKNVRRFIRNYMPAVLAATVMLTLFLAYRDRVAYEHCILLIRRNTLLRQYDDRASSRKAQPFPAAAVTELPLRLEEAAAGSEVTLTDVAGNSPSGESYTFTVRGSYGGIIRFLNGVDMIFPPLTTELDELTYKDGAAEGVFTVKQRNIKR